MTFHLAATLVQMASQMWDETAFLTQLCMPNQSCAPRKIVVNPVLSICEIQGAWKMILCKNEDFLVALKQKVPGPMVHC